MSDDDILYSVRGLSVDYETRLGPVRAVDSVDLDIKRGEILGLVGESGCGKSTLGRALMLMPPGTVREGELLFDGTDLTTISDKELREIRGGRIGMVFQDPMTSLNPIEKIVDQLTETIRTHRPDVSEAEARARAEEVVDTLGIRVERIDDYPHQFSGGMRQRVMISLALALQGDLVIADEPTTALDVIVEAQFLDLLRALVKDLGVTIVLITHNIGVVAEIADRVAVMYAGKLVELAPVHELFAETRHPYSRGLLRSVPNIDLDGAELYKMDGAPPNLLAPPPGCSFHPRCPDVMDICPQAEPSLLPLDEDEEHHASCWLYQEHPVTIEAPS